MGDFGVFPAPGQANFLQQRPLRRWAENFQKVWYKKLFFEKFLETLLSFPELYVAPQRVFTDLSPTALTKRLSEGGIRDLDD